MDWPQYKVESASGKLTSERRSVVFCLAESQVRILLAAPLRLARRARQCAGGVACEALHVGRRRYAVTRAQSSMLTCCQRLTNATNRTLTCAPAKLLPYGLALHSVR